MGRNLASDTLPWVTTIVAVAALLAAWLYLYFFNIDLIQTGAVSQVNRNVVVSKVIIDYSGLLAALIVAVGVIYKTWTKSIPLLIQEIARSLRSLGESPTPLPSSGKVDAVVEKRQGKWRTLFLSVFGEILLLGRMGECEDFQQWLSHFLIMWGFIGLAVTTTLDAIFNFSAIPLPIISPIRLLGNITGIIFVAGLTLSISRRFFNQRVRKKSNRQDWIFLFLLYGTAISGFVVQVFGSTGNVAGTWVSYPTHLAFIAFLLITAPWSKFIHALWRPSWIVETKLRTGSG